MNFDTFYHKSQCMKEKKNRKKHNIFVKNTSIDYRK